MYQLENQNQSLLVIVYVDNFFIMSNNQTNINQIKQNLKVSSKC